MPIRRPHRQLGDAAREAVAGVGNLEARAVLVVLLCAIGAAREHVDIRVDVNTAKSRAERASVVAAKDGLDVHTPAFARANDILDVLGAKRCHAADRTGAIDVGGGTTDDIDAADQFGVEEKRAVGEVPRALVVLPRTIDNDDDAAEVLQAADVDRGRRLVATVLNPHARHIIEKITNGAGLARLDLPRGHDADRRKCVDGTLFSLGRCRRDGVERLHRCRAAGLGTGVHDVRCCLLRDLRLGLLALGLLRPIRRRTFGLRLSRLRETALRRQGRN